MENQILLEKVGESKTQKLLDECNNIYMEEFQKEYPNYFENNYCKAICKILVTEKDSNEIKGIGMSCLNDLLTQNFANWLGGWLGANSSTTGGVIKSTSGFVGSFGNSHGGSNFSHWGNFNAPPNNAGLNITIGNGTDIPLKTDFASPSGGVKALTVNAGFFNSGLTEWFTQHVCISFKYLCLFSG